MKRLSFLVLCVIGGCGSGTDPDAGLADTGPSDASAPAPAMLGPTERPARLVAPPQHDGLTERPLVMLLHGYTVTAAAQDIYFGMTRRARRDGFYLLLPDGTIDARGEPHWDVLGAVVDDHAYLRGLLEEATEVLPVDRASISVVGHSNGGFMAYRLACDSADLVTSIASLAGSDAVSECAPAEDVAVLQIHGDADDTVLYGGGSIAGFDYPAAPVVAETWATRAGCELTAATMGERMDLIADVDGAETNPLVYEAGCRAAVELWRMEGASHIPPLRAEFTPQMVGWLLDHARVD